MLQTHYVNATHAEDAGRRRGRGELLDHPEGARSPRSSGTLFATKQIIRICESNPTPTLPAAAASSRARRPSTIIGANGHFHSPRQGVRHVRRGTARRSTTPADAQRFYQSTAWDEPPMLHSPELDVAVPAERRRLVHVRVQWRRRRLGDRLRRRSNASTRRRATPAADSPTAATRSAPIVDKNEHCNAFVYYYPKQDNVTCK